MVKLRTAEGPVVGERHLVQHIGRAAGLLVPSVLGGIDQGRSENNLEGAGVGHRLYSLVEVYLDRQAAAWACLEGEGPRVPQGLVQVLNQLVEEGLAGTRGQDREVTRAQVGRLVRLEAGENSRMWEAEGSFQPL